MSSLRERFERANAQVVGITCDGVPVLAAWARHMGGVDFPLCSDFWPHGAAARAYGVFNEETGRPERVVLVIDERGTVRYIDHHMRREVPDEEEIFGALQAIG